MDVCFEKVVTNLMGSVESSSRTDGKSRHKHVRDNIRDIFNAIDLDKSGFLEKNEMMNFYTKIGFESKFAESDIDDSDENNDGKLSFDEFLHSLLKTVFDYSGDCENSANIVDFFGSMTQVAYNESMSRLFLRLKEVLSENENAALLYEAEMRQLLTEHDQEIHTNLAIEFSNLFMVKISQDDVDFRKSIASGTISSSMRLRGLTWRRLLGIIHGETGHWADQLQLLRFNYNTTKQQILGNLSTKLNVHEMFIASDLAQKDLTPPTTASEVTFEEVSDQVKSFALMCEISKDLNRLFITGVHDDFFKTCEHQDVLRSVLLLWSLQNPSISYRQGMHEIAGIVLYCLEVERLSWDHGVDTEYIIPSHAPVLLSIAGAFQHTTLEADTYEVFSAIMKDLKCLYDPAHFTGKGPTDPSTGKSVQTSSTSAVVAYSHYLQNVLLAEVDPELHQCLQRHGVNPQLYGMRWARLLLSREIPVTGAGCLRLWDYILAGVGELRQSEGANVGTGRISYWRFSF